MTLKRSEVIKTPATHFYDAGQKIYIDVAKAERGPFKDFIDDTCRKADKAIGYIRDEYIVTENNKTFIFVSVGLTDVNVLTSFVNSSTEYGVDAGGYLLIHESFFSLVANEEEKKLPDKKQEETTLPKKDWRDCWYGRYGYPDE